MQQTQESQCLNCGALEVARYCTDCGQRNLGHRLTVRTLLTQTLSVVLDLNQGILPTLKDLTLRPGVMVAAYIGGQRRRYLNPISYFLIVATLQIIDFMLSGDTLIANVSERMREVNALREAPLTEPEIMAAAESYVESLANWGVYFVPVLACIPYALLLRLFHYRGGYNVAELFIFALFTFSHSMLLTSMTSPLSMQGGFTFYAGFTMTVFVAFAAWAGAVFFKRWWHGLTTVLAFLPAYVLFSVGSSFLIGVEQSYLNK